MKKKYEVTGTFNYWLGTMWMVFSIFELISTESGELINYFFSFLIGTLFWGIAQIEVNGKYLRGIRDNSGG